MTSTIEEIIEEIETFIEEEGRPAAFSSQKIVLNRDKLEEYLEDLKTATPEEIKRYKRLIANRDAIISDAENKAKNMIKQAEEQTKQLLSEHQIMQEAYAKANEVIMIAERNAQTTVNEAAAEADDIRSSAIEYTDHLLENIQSVLTDLIDVAKSRNEAFIKKMQSILNTVDSNRGELEAISASAADSSDGASPTEHDVSESNTAADSSEDENAEPYDMRKDTEEKPDNDKADGSDEKKDSDSVEVPAGFFEKR